MRHLFNTLLVFSAVVCTGWAQIEIIEVKGVVDVKRPEDKDWIEAKKGMQLAKDAQICTGYESEVTLRFAKNVKVTIRPITHAKIEAIMKDIQKKRLEAELHIKWGEARAKTQKGRTQIGYKGYHAKLHYVRKGDRGGTTRIFG
jgi:hypothetical protein